jgi:hypothetical protein
LCEQPIPHEELLRIETKEQARSDEIAARIREHYSRQRAQDEATAKAEIDRVKNAGEDALKKQREENLAQIATAREEAKVTTVAEFKTRLAEADAARSDAENRCAALNADFERWGHEEQKLKANLQKAQVDTAEAVEMARREERAAVQSALREAIEAAENAKDDALRGQAELEEERDQARRDAGDAVANVNRVKEEAAVREAAVRAEATQVAETSAQNRIAAAEEAQRAAAARLQEAEAAHAETLLARLTEQRASLEKDGLKKLQDERAVWFNEKQKLEEKLQDVTRQLQNKPVDELGEGAELDLFELLKQEFSEDKITRFAKGTPGADTLHDIYHNGTLCGRIVYESKNSSRWLNDYVAKLRRDQIAAEADHAILSTFKLPANAKHVHLQDAVIVCQPARVLVLAQILRRHIVQVHNLRHSNEERANKTEVLYEFITSARFGQLIDEVKVHTQTLEDIDVSEAKVHKKTWEKRGEVIRKIRRAHGDLQSEIDRIIGTAADVPTFGGENDEIEVLS